MKKLKCNRWQAHYCPPNGSSLSPCFLSFLLFSPPFFPFLLPPPLFSHSPSLNRQVLKVCGVAPLGKGTQ